MALPTLLLTELDAVNLMLASIGQTPVNTLAVAGIRDVAVAQLSLQNVTRSVLTEGWSFNTDEEYELAFNGSGQVEVPAAVMWLDPTDRSKDLVVRADTSDGNKLKLWDKANLTFVLSTNHTAPILVDIIWAFIFENLPQPVRDYIATRAARVFQSQVLASDVLYKFTSDMELQARASLLKLEARTKDRNWFTSGADVNNILTRQRNVSRWR